MIEWVNVTVAHDDRRATVRATVNWGHPNPDDDAQWNARYELRTHVGGRPPGTGLGRAWVDDMEDAAMDAVHNAGPLSGTYAGNDWPDWLRAVVRR